MSFFLVLVTRHFYCDEHTTQLNVYTKAEDKGLARTNVQRKYPSDYRPSNQGLVAFFTGEIYQLV